MNQYKLVETIAVDDVIVINDNVLFVKEIQEDTAKLRRKLISTNGNKSDWLYYDQVFEFLGNNIESVTFNLKTFYEKLLMQTRHQLEGKIAKSIDTISNLQLVIAANEQLHAEISQMYDAYFEAKHNGNKKQKRKVKKAILNLKFKNTVSTAK